MQHTSQLGSDCSKYPSTAARGGAACAAVCAAISQISLPPTLLVRLQDPALIKEKTGLSGLPEKPTECILERSVTSKRRRVATSKVLWRGSSDMVQIPERKQKA